MAEFAHEQNLVRAMDCRKKSLDNAVMHAHRPISTIVAIALVLGLTPEGLRASTHNSFPMAQNSNVVERGESAGQVPVPAQPSLSKQPGAGPEASPPNGPERKKKSKVKKYTAKARS